MPPNMASRVLGVRRIQHATESLPQSSLALLRIRCLKQPSAAPFSTTAPKCRRDNNPMRGLSAMRATGLRGKRLSVRKSELPEPVWDPAQRSEIETDPNHGLWGFFNRDKTLITTPDEDSSHGRAWTVQELRRKSWDDLHSLWWKCVKERNRLSTEAVIRQRNKIGYGEFEADTRDDVIRETQKAIKHTLTERMYSWEDARKLVRSDPEIAHDMDGTIRYVPVEGTQRRRSQDLGMDDMYEASEVFDHAEATDADGETSELRREFKSDGDLEDVEKGLKDIDVAARDGVLDPIAKKEDRV